MNKLLLTLMAFLLVAAAGLGGYWFGNSGKMPEKKDAESKAVQTAEQKIKYWVAPMDPTYIRKEPGKSPMGMDLIPVFEDEESESTGGSVSIDPVTVQNMGVRTAVVERRKMTRNIRTVGIVAYDEKRVTQVQSKVEGWIEKLYIDFTGQFVNKDDILLELYSPQLVSSQEEYLAALEFSDKMKENPYPEIAGGADSLMRSARKRLDYLDVPKHQIMELTKGRKVMKSLHIHSPNKGIVINKHIQEGAYVKPGMPLYTLADISKVWVHADIYEYELPWVKEGQEVTMTLSYYPGRAFKGKVAYIYPYLEAKTRTVKVRLEFDNKRLELKPDMYANVLISSLIADNPIAVPSEAVIRSGERNVVITSIGKGKFLPKDVRLGVASGDGYYEILDGLKAGDRIVTSAHFLIDSESRLKEAIGKMLETKRKPSEDTHEGHDMDDMDMSDMSLDDDMDMSNMNMDDMDLSDMKMESK
ncbi:MAG: efflux RND transporter periplasmic adaptor subunit [bacterium]|nr:efflux RND transporter periplasmic adaptor subunit [bacterium]